MAPPPPKDFGMAPPPPTGVEPYKIESPSTQAGQRTTQPTKAEKVSTQPIQVEKTATQPAQVGKAPTQATQKATTPTAQKTPTQATQVKSAQAGKAPTSPEKKVQSEQTSKPPTPTKDAKIGMAPPPPVGVLPFGAEVMAPPPPWLAALKASGFEIQRFYEACAKLDAAIYRRNKINDDIKELSDLGVTIPGIDKTKNNKIHSELIEFNNKLNNTRQDYNQFRSQLLQTEVFLRGHHPEYESAAAQTETSIRAARDSKAAKEKVVKPAAPMFSSYKTNASSLNPKVEGTPQANTQGNPGVTLPKASNKSSKPPPR